MESIKYKKAGRVMVFGVFDGLHNGHQFFLRQAKKYGDQLIAVVARDAAARELKNKTPHFDEKKRARMLRTGNLADRVVLGDRKQGTYRVLRRYQPDVICFGYDQDTLADDLRQRMRKGSLPKMRLIRLRPHNSDTFRSSLLRGRGRR